MDSKLYHRKHPRLKDYDYSQNGCYFVTICTKDKAKILGAVVGRGFPDAPLMELSIFGKCCENALSFLGAKSSNINAVKYIIMPNHIHILVMINNYEENGGASGKPRPAEAVLPRFVSSLKRYTNRVSKTQLWQDGYYDHIIRNDADYLSHWQYIDDNPAKWAEDEYYS